MADRIPLEGSSTAPVLVFDGAPMLGLIEGMGRISLDVLVHDEMPDGTVVNRRVVVAHLRGNRIAFESLRSAINQLEFMAQPVEQGESGKPN